MKLILLGLPILWFLGAPERPPSPRVLVIPIQGELNPSHIALVRRAARVADDRPPHLFVLELDTPGGRADVMLSLGEEVMKLAPIPTAAYVRPMGSGGGAWSAGVYVAISCDRLFMFPGTVIGAAAPVSPTGEEIPEKYVSAMREKFRARADQKGYPGSLIAAMVDKDLELFEAVVDGERRYLTSVELERLRREGVKIRDSPSLFLPKGKLLTLTDRQGVETGLGLQAPDRGAIYAQFGLSSPLEEIIAPSWSERLVGLLTSGVAVMILLALGVFGIWVEFQSPGFGVPGVVGILAFALLLFGHHLAGLAEAPEILLFILGIGLIAAEVFLLPGTGFLAISGVICLLVALILSLQGASWPDPEEAPWQVDLLLDTLGRILVGLLAGGVAAAFALRFLPRVPILGRLVHDTQLVDASPAEAVSAELTGREGRAVTPLRPGGKAEVGGRTLDVVTEGEYVSPGGRIRIERVEGMRVIVSRVDR